MQKVTIFKPLVEDRFNGEKLVRGTEAISYNTDQKEVAGIKDIDTTVTIFFKNGTSIKYCGMPYILTQTQNDR